MTLKMNVKGVRDKLVLCVRACVVCLNECWIQVDICLMSDMDGQGSVQKGELSYIS